MSKIMKIAKGLLKFFTVPFFSYGKSQIELPEKFILGTQFL